MTKLIDNRYMKLYEFSFISVGDIIYLLWHSSQEDKQRHCFDRRSTQICNSTERVWTHLNCYQNKCSLSNGNSKKSAHWRTNHKKHKNQQPYRQINNPTKRSYVNAVVTGLCKKRSFTKITNNKEISERIHQEDINRLNVNNLSNQEVSVEQRIRKLSLVGLRKRGLCCS